MTPAEWTAVLTGASVIISQLGTTWVTLTRARADALNARASREAIGAHLSKQDVKLDELHLSTNGKMDRLLKLTAESSEAKGRLDQRDNPR